MKALPACPDCGGNLGVNATKCRCGWKAPGNDLAPGPGRKLCAYCERVATASVSGTWHCSGHGQDAMDGVPVPMFKNAVVAKPVSGS